MAACGRERIPADSWLLITPQGRPLARSMASPWSPCKRSALPMPESQATAKTRLVWAPHFCPLPPQQDLPLW